VDWCVVAIAASAAALAASAYSLAASRRSRKLVAALLRAAGLESRIARSLARVRERPRKRYIVFEVLSGERIGEDEVRGALRRAARELLGAPGEALSLMRLVEYDESARRGIVRVRSDYKMHALAVLASIRRIGGRRVMFVPVSTHGTIKAARRRVRRR